MDAFALACCFLGWPHTTGIQDAQPALRPTAGRRRPAGNTMLPKPSRVILLALASRLTVLACMLLSDWTFEDLDSSATLPIKPCAIAGAPESNAGAKEGNTAMDQCCRHVPPAQTRLTISPATLAFRWGLWPRRLGHSVLWAGGTLRL